uniref:Uncharacterized protein n=1 Tax=mine drainage metagenome TaxID=410659 RepID=E6QIT4_9ZZZZ
MFSGSDSKALFFLVQFVTYFFSSGV